MDKASIIKDAIEYIQTLHEDQKRIGAEISELELGRSSDSPIFDFDQEVTTFYSKPKRSRRDNCCFGSKLRSTPIEVIEVCHFSFCFYNFSKDTASSQLSIQLGR